MFLVPVPKDSTCLASIFYCAFETATLVAVYNPSFADEVDLVLEGHKQILDGIAPLK